MLAAWLLLLHTQAPPELGLVDRLAGEYRHAAEVEDQREVERAIDRVVSRMNWFTRGIARRRLRAASDIPRLLRISRKEARILIDFDGRPRETALRAPPMKVIGTTGAELAYTLDVDGGSLVQRFEGARGGQLNAIRAGDQSDSIVVTVTIFSRSLPEPVVYQLRYARASK